MASAHGVCRNSDCATEGCSRACRHCRLEGRLPSARTRPPGCHRPLCWKGQRQSLDELSGTAAADQVGAPTARSCGCCRLVGMTAPLWDHCRSADAVLTSSTHHRVLPSAMGGKAGGAGRLWRDNRCVQSNQEFDRENLYDWAARRAQPPQLPTQVEEKKQSRRVVDASRVGTATHRGLGRSPPPPASPPGGTTGTPAARCHAATAAPPFPPQGPPRRHARSGRSRRPPAAVRQRNDLRDDRRVEQHALRDHAARGDHGQPAVLDL